MANAFVGASAGGTAPIAAPAPAPTLGTTYLHPIIAKALASIPNITHAIVSSPQYPALVQSHPNPSIVATLGANAPGFGTPTQPSNYLTPPTSSSSSIVAAKGANAPGFATPIQPSNYLTPPTADANSMGIPTPQQIAAALPTLPTTPPPVGVGSSPLSAPPYGAAPVGAPIGQPSGPVAPTAASIDQRQQYVAPQGGPITPWQGVNTLPPGYAYNAYGQMYNMQTQVGGALQDVQPGPGVLNHVPYSPALTGLSQYGGLMTPNGTPVTMSNWQRSNLNPSAVTGPGGYEDYAQQVAGWSPTDLANQGKNITGNFGTDLVAPKNFTPLPVDIAPAGG